MKEVEQQKHLLFPLLVILIVAVASLLVVKPKISNILQTRKNISVDKVMLGKLTQKADTLAGLDQAELEEKLDLSLKVLPAEKEIPLLLSSLRLIAQESGLTFKSINTDPGDLSTESAKIAKESSDPLKLSLSLSGDLIQVRDFLVLVDKIAPLFKITKADLNNEGSGSDISIEVTGLYLPLPNSLGVVDSPVALLSPEEEKVYLKLTELKFYDEEQTDFPEIPSGKENPFAY